MKKAISLVLVSLLLFSSILFFPQKANAKAQVCYDESGVCRQNALNSDNGWIKMTLMLTWCDIVLGRCLWENAKG
jgi:hypothetical protein